MASARMATDEAVVGGKNATGSPSAPHHGKRLNASDVTDFSDIFMMIQSQSMATVPPSATLLGVHSTVEKRPSELHASTDVSRTVAAARPSALLLGSQAVPVGLTNPMHRVGRGRVNKEVQGLDLSDVSKPTEKGGLATVDGKALPTSVSDSTVRSTISQSKNMDVTAIWQLDGIIGLSVSQSPGKRESPSGSQAVKHAPVDVPFVLLSNANDSGRMVRGELLSTATVGASSSSNKVGLGRSEHSGQISHKLGHSMDPNGVGQKNDEQFFTTLGLTTASHGGMSSSFESKGVRASEPTIDLRHSDWLSEVAKISYQQGSALPQTALNVKVHPEGMGTIVIHAVHKDGGVSLNLSASNPMVANLLNQSLQSLRDTIQSQGVDITGVMVSYNTGLSQGNQFAGEQKKSQHSRVEWGRGRSVGGLKSIESGVHSDSSNSANSTFYPSTSMISVRV